MLQADNSLASNHLPWYTEDWCTALLIQANTKNYNYQEGEEKYLTFITNEKPPKKALYSHSPT